jgi:hypothetical protein
MKKRTSYLTPGRAIDILHKGGRLMVMHGGLGREWLILPDGFRVKPSDAQRIVRRPDIVASNDGLFPGHHQTWRRRA